MKSNFFLLVTAIACMYSATTYAQRKVTDIADVFTNYEKDTYSQQEGKTGKEKEKLAYNPKMLNMFIANNISTYLSSSKDISLQKYYAIIESGEGSLFIGYNFMFRKDKITRLKNILNVGLKTDMENNFSTLWKDNKINPELALNLKYTHIWRGYINYDEKNKKHESIIKNYRSNYIKKKYEDELKKYGTSDPGPNANENTELEARLRYVTTLSNKEKNEVIEKEYVAQYEKIATDEEKFITDNKMFNSFVSKWITIETYIPAGKREYKLSPASAVFATTDEKFYNFNASLYLTRMQKWADKKTLYTTLSLSAFNTNNIITKELKAYKFETIVNQGGSNQTVGDSKDAYVGAYKSDFAKSIKAEIVYFFIKDITGLSLSFEAVTGDLSARNWKIAIPLSLKDKDDKPSVNFELQYKEVYSTHLVGISVGFAFGKYFK